MKKTEKKITEQKREEWFNAIRKNDMDAIKKMIGDGFDVNCRNKYNAIALHEASYYNFRTLAKLLLDNGAEVNVQDFFGNTPLHIACVVGYIEMVKLLIHNGANFTKNKDGDTPLDCLKIKQPQKSEDLLGKLLEWLSENHPEKMLEYMASESVQGRGVEL